jgi:glycosyltransferase involved in cell wall biosynthesis
MSPKFSIIIPHYDGSITDESFERGIQCLLNQEFKDFEVLIYHDGPVSRPIPAIWEKLQNKKLKITESRYNNWGHSLRDMGIKESTGEYIVHFNPDNVLYSNALKEINDLIEDQTYVMLRSKTNDNRELILGSNNIIIFPIIMIGVYRWGVRGLTGTRIKGDTKHGVIMNGEPAEYANIDCMQLVMKRKLWLDYGGWYDKQEVSDGLMYKRFVQDHPARCCSKVLGEHW